MSADPRFPAIHDLVPTWFAAAQKIENAAKAQTFYDPEAIGEARMLNACANELWDILKEPRP